jgi:hypothetical protein
VASADPGAGVSSQQQAWGCRTHSTRLLLDAAVDVEQVRLPRQEGDHVAPGNGVAAEAL